MFWVRSDHPHKCNTSFDFFFLFCYYYFRFKINCITTKVQEYIVQNFLFFLILQKLTAPLGKDLLGLLDFVLGIESACRRCVLLPRQFLLKNHHSVFYVVWKYMVAYWKFIGVIFRSAWELFFSRGTKIINILFRALKHKIIKLFKINKWLVQFFIHITFSL